MPEKFEIIGQIVRIYIICAGGGVKMLLLPKQLEIILNKFILNTGNYTSVTFLVFHIQGVAPPPTPSA